MSGVLLLLGLLVVAGSGPTLALRRPLVDHSAIECSDRQKNDKVGLQNLQQSLRGLHWTFTQPVCNPNGSSSYDGVKCELTDGCPVVTELLLQRRGLVGAIPQGLDLCDSLRSINFSNDEDTSGTANAISELSARLDKFPALQFIRVDGNPGIKILSSSLAGSSIFYLSANSCNLVSIPMSRGLRTLRVSRNPIPLLPAEFVSVMKNLSWLDLADTLITQLPDDFGNLQLDRLDLSNSLKLLLLPLSFSNLTKLQQLTLRGCALKSIPDLDGELLQHLDVSYCPNLVGLPRLHSAKLLQTVRASFSPKLSVVPMEYGSSTLLTSFSMSHCNLTTFLLSANWTSLTDLELSVNFLRGSLKDIKMGRVVNINLAQNNFSSYPLDVTSASPYPSLISLVLDRNPLGDSNFSKGMNSLRKLSCDGCRLQLYPSCVVDQTAASLEHLSLASNYLREFAGVLLTFPRLQILNLAENVLMIGPIPTSFRGFELHDWGIQQLVLQYTSLSGSFPWQFSRLLQLILVNIDGTNIEGYLAPDLFQRSEMFYIFSARNTRLRGPIPSGKPLSSLLRMFFDGTNMTGDKPTWLQLTNTTVAFYDGIYECSQLGPYQVTLSPQYNWDWCRCSRHHWGVPNRTCIACTGDTLGKCNCPGGATMTCQPSYYAIAQSEPPYVKLISCGVELSFGGGSVETTCNPNGDAPLVFNGSFYSNKTCKEGFNNTSFACSNCQDKQYRVGGECRECGSQAWVFLGLFLAFATTGLALLCVATFGIFKDQCLIAADVCLTITLAMLGSPALIPLTILMAATGCLALLIAKIIVRKCDLHFGHDEIVTHTGFLKLFLYWFQTTTMLGESLWVVALAPLPFGSFQCLEVLGFLYPFEGLVPRLVFVGFCFVVLIFATLVSCCRRGIEKYGRWAEPLVLLIMVSLFEILRSSAAALPNFDAGDGVKRISYAPFIISGDLSFYGPAIAGLSFCGIGVVLLSILVCCKRKYVLPILKENYQDGHSKYWEIAWIWKRVGLVVLITVAPKQIGQILCELILVTFGFFISTQVPFKSKLESSLCGIADALVLSITLFCNATANLNAAIAYFVLGINGIYFGVLVIGLFIPFRFLTMLWGTILRICAERKRKKMRNNGKVQYETVSEEEEFLQAKNSKTEQRKAEKNCSSESKNPILLANDEDK